MFRLRLACHRGSRCGGTAARAGAHRVGPGRVHLRRIISQGTPRRMTSQSNAGARGATPADRVSGWRRPDGCRPLAARSLASRPVARGRSRASAAGAMDIDAEMRAAQETVDALAAARGSGGRPSVATAGGASLWSGLRGSSRMLVETDCDCEEVEDLRSASPTVVWTPSQRQQFAVRGGVSAGVEIDQHRSAEPSTRTRRLASLKTP